MRTPTQTLRMLLQEPGLITMPCCYDALSAKLIEQAGFPLTFMSGFAVSAARLGLPDTGLISFGEMVDQGRNICSAVSIPVIGDGDTGYGNPINVRRTVEQYARAGFAAIMIEDQVWPKRCGHTQGKAVVERDEAFARIRAAVDTRDEGHDTLIMARTDARTTDGLDEALFRSKEFKRLGADVLFIEAPESVEEMQIVCAELAGPKMVNLLEGGKTPVLPAKELECIGFKIAAYPLTLLSSAVKAMTETLELLAKGQPLGQHLLAFDVLRNVIGFDAYYEQESRYR